MARDRRGRFTAERTTEQTHTTRITERITVDDGTLTALPPLEVAHGWDPGPIHPRSLHLAQRRGQVLQAEYHLRKWVLSCPGEPVPDRLIREAVNILRAGPDATLMELEDGRSI
jgi:hypothetical protein